MELFLENGHLSDQGLQALVDGSLDEMQRLEAAEHLSFCDECLMRYTQRLSEDVLEQPAQNVTLPVMRRLRQRAAAAVFNRYAAAAAAVIVTGALWYGGVFGGMMQAVTPSYAPLAQSSTQQSQEQHSSGGWRQALQNWNQQLLQGFHQAENKSSSSGAAPRPAASASVSQPENQQ